MKNWFSLRYIKKHPEVDRNFVLRPRKDTDHPPVHASMERKRCARHMCLAQKLVLAVHKQTNYYKIRFWCTQISPNFRSLCTKAGTVSAQKSHTPYWCGQETRQTSKWLTNELRFMLNRTLHRAHPLFSVY